MKQVLIILIVYSLFSTRPVSALREASHHEPKAIGELHHTQAPCEQTVRGAVVPDLLGDLSRFADAEGLVYFTSFIPSNKGVANTAVEVEYEAEIHKVSQRDRGFQQVVQGLKTRAVAHANEQEAGALSFVAGDRRITVYFSSRSSLRIAAKNHRYAMDRFLKRTYAWLREWSKDHGEIPADFSIERFHTHPSFVNLPHSGQDVLEDYRFDEWMRASSLLGKMRFRSYVIPLFYRGDLYVEFEPRRHRLF